MKSYRCASGAGNAVAGPSGAAGSHEGHRHAGFTLIELIVAVVVFLVLCAAVVVNWSSFMRYQELRQDALSLHKEVMAQKARALENGDSVMIVRGANVNIVTVSARVVVNETVPTYDWEDVKTIKLNDRMKVAAANTGGCSPDTVANKWFVTGGTAGAAKINISNNNLNAFEDGWIIITSEAVKNKSFCIKVEKSQSIKPEIYQKSGSGTWNKM